MEGGKEEGGGSEGEGAARAWERRQGWGEERRGGENRGGEGRKDGGKVGVVVRGRVGWGVLSRCSVANQPASSMLLTLLVADGLPGMNVQRGCRARGTLSGQPVCQGSQSVKAAARVCCAYA